MRWNQVCRLRAAAIPSRWTFNHSPEILGPAILSRFFSSKEEKGRLSMLLGLSVGLGHRSHLLEVHFLALDQERQVVQWLLLPLAAFSLAVSGNLDRRKLLMVVVTVVELH